MNGGNIIKYLFLIISIYICYYVWNASSPSYEGEAHDLFFQKWFQNEDERHVTEVMTSSNLTDYQTMHRSFYRLTANPLQSYCRVLKRVGGNWFSQCSFVDGAKWICIDDIMRDVARSKCLVYSFGINNEWSFDDQLANMGCQVFSFDPTMKIDTHQRSKNLMFYKLGISGKTKDQFKSLKDIFKLTENKDEYITYLKMDIEGHEVEVMNNVLETNLLKNVKQIAMEWHTHPTIHSITAYYNILRKLYEQGFRIISYEPNGCYGKRQDIFLLFEIVFRKVV